MLFDDLFNELASNWNRPFKEKDGFQIMEAKDGHGFVMAFNTLGIKADDIHVEYEKYSSPKRFYDDGRVVNCTYFKVYGNSRIPELGDRTFTVNYEFLFKDDKKIDDVQTIVRDGLTIVYIKTSEPIETDSTVTNAKKIAEGGSFDW